MGLETATYISDLVVTNPVGSSDLASTSDDHLRLIKSAIKTTFPNVSGATTSTHTELNKLAAANNTGAAADEVGYKGMPLNNQTAGSYGIVLSDMGKYINCGGGFTYTFPANASIPCPVGSIVLFYNSGGSSCTITVGGTDLMGLAGTALNGARTLASGGMATFLKTTATVWVGSGAGLS